MAGHVFVSYGRSDVGYVNRLADTLTRAGLSIWKDDRNIEVGDRWEHEVRDRVDDCAAMVIVMSPAAEASMNVANELARARDRGKTIFPVLLSGEVWFALSTINYFDARDRRLPDQRLIEQLRHLGTAVEGRTDPGSTLLAGDLPGQAIAWQHRPGLLDALVSSAAGGGTTVVAALAGQRGVGKTQLAAAYARLRMQHRWPVIVWANAGSEQGIITALDELADAARLRQLGDDPTEAARAALRWLRRHAGPCLLVYDNAVDPDLIRTWTPSVGTVQTVVTSTMRALDALGPLIDVSLFTPGEATAYLDRRTKLKDPDGAAELAVNLGYLPLALAQAAAVIGPGRRYPTYRKYIWAIDAAPTAKLLPRTAGDPYPHGLVEAVLLALDDLSKASDGIQARHLLDRLAVLAPVGADSILLNVLTRTNTTDHGEVATEAAESASELGDPDELAAVLTGRSLTVGADSDRVVIHRLIQRIVRECCRQAGTLTSIVTAGAAAVADAAERVADRWQQRALLAEYSQHAQSLLTEAEGAATEAVVRLQGRLLYLLNENYSYSVSVSTGPDIVLAHQQVLGPDHPDTLRASRDLARAYRAVGRLNEALALSTGTLADYERVLGPVHPDTLTARLNVASAYREMGRLDQAIALVTRTLADRERVLGSDHPDTLTARLNLAAAYREIGRLYEAVALLTRTLADRDRVLGPDHPNTFSARLNLADTYQAMGRLDESIGLLTGTLAHSERALGIDHPHTLTARHSLAFAYRMVGRLAEAIDLYTRVLDDRERVLGPDHPSTFGSRNNLAYTYQLAGQVDEALALFTRTLADRERVLGPDHPNTLGSRHNLAQANQAVGRIDEALALFTRALADRERVLGPEHPHTRLTRNNLAAAYRAAGRAEDADTLLRPDEPRSE